eukprot:3017836-Rhodomonas_salina.5
MMVTFARKCDCSSLFDRKRIECWRRSRSLRSTSSSPKRSSSPATERCACIATAACACVAGLSQQPSTLTFLHRKTAGHCGSEQHSRRFCAGLATVTCVVAHGSEIGGWTVASIMCDLDSFHDDADDDDDNDDDDDDDDDDPSHSGMTRGSVPTDPPTRSEPQQPHEGMCQA